MRNSPHAADLPPAQHPPQLHRPARALRHAPHLLRHRFPTAPLRVSACKPAPAAGGLFRGRLPTEGQRQVVGSGEIRDRLATEDHRLSDNPTVGIRLGDEIDGDGGMRGVEVGDVDVRLSDVELYGALVKGSGGEASEKG